MRYYDNTPKFNEQATRKMATIIGDLYRDVYSPNNKSYSLTLYKLDKRFKPEGLRLANTLEFHLCTRKYVESVAAKHRKKGFIVKINGEL